MSSDIQAVFLIAGLGLAIGMIHTVLKLAGKEDFAHWTTLIGIAIILVMVLSYIGDLFMKIKSVFQLN